VLIIGLITYDLIALCFGGLIGTCLWLVVVLDAAHNISPPLDNKFVRELERWIELLKLCSFNLGSTPAGWPAQ
jgi:hypothetical protein